MLYYSGQIVIKSTLNLQIIIKMEFETLVSRIQRFYAHTNPKLQGEILAKVIMQYDLLEVLDDTIVNNTENNDKLMDIIENKLPFFKTPIMKSSNVSYTHLFDNKHVEFNTENKKIIITVPPAEKDTHYRCNTGICISPMAGSCLLLMCKKYTARPLVIDATSDAIVFLEFIVPASENTTQVEFDMFHFLIKRLDKSQTVFKKATSYFAKYGALSNYKSESTVHLNADGHMDANRETFSDPEEIKFILIIPRKRVIGEIIPLCGRWEDEVFNPDFEYDTSKASFLYPIFKIETTFILNDDRKSKSKNGGFNGCFYQIENYAVLVNAFKLLAKAKKHSDTVHARINAKVWPKEKKLQYIEAILQRSKNMRAITDLLKNIPQTVEGFTPIKESDVTIPMKIERQSALLENIEIVRNKKNFANLCGAIKRERDEDDSLVEEEYLKKQKTDE